ASTAIELWHLAKRQIFREASRGQVLGAARQQGEERATRRVRTACAAVEPRRDVGAPERMLEEAEVALWRADKHADLVETNAAARFREDAPRNLDALAA